MIRFFIFTFLLNISLFNVNSSENKSNDNIPYVPEEEKLSESNKENEEEKLSGSMSLNKKNGGEVDLNLLVKDLLDEFDNSLHTDKEINNNKNINSSIDDNVFNNLNNEEENSMKHENNISNYDLNVSEMQENIDKNDDKGSDIYDKFNINKVKVQKGVRNDKTDLSGLGKKKQEVKEETPNCCGVCMKAFCG